MALAAGLLIRFVFPWWMIAMLRTPPMSDEDRKKFYRIM
jgi:hypothetical protein